MRRGTGSDVPAGSVLTYARAGLTHLAGGTLAGDACLHGHRPPTPIIGATAAEGARALTIRGEMQKGRPM